VAYVRVSRSDGGMLHGDRMVSARVSRSRNSNVNLRVSGSDGGMLRGGMANARVPGNEVVACVLVSACASETSPLST
jgi:hypothetical protein